MSPSYDVVLHGGWVVDGTGAPPVRADVGLVGDRITAVGRLEAASSAERVECTGRYLLPGLVDAHTHVDAMVFDPQVQLANLAQGVTSCIVGQDGLSFAPAPSPATAAYVDDYFGAVNGSWPGTPPRTAAEMLAAYDGTTALNVGMLVGQGNLRYAACGTSDAPSGPDAVRAMQAMLEQSLDEGALGLSSGLDYIPGRFADAAELGTLATTAAEFGVPYVTHMRGYEAAAAAGMAEVRQIAEISNAAVHVSHYHGPAHMLAGLIDDLRREGIDATFDSYPYTHGSSILAMVAVPAWLQAQGTATTVQSLCDPGVRANLRRDWFADRADTMGGIRLSYVAAADYSWTEGLLLPEAAARAGIDIADFVCDVLVAARLRVGCVFRQPPTNTDADVRALLRHEAQLGGSDAIYLGGRPHPRGWGAFARLLGRHTRELGDWTWGQAASHLAGHPARRFGLTNRGLIRPGFAADVVVLDASAIRDTATYDDPRRTATGVDRVYVNGVLAYREGALTGTTPGRALRRAAC